MNERATKPNACGCGGCNRPDDSDSVLSARGDAAQSHLHAVHADDAADNAADSHSGCCGNTPTHDSAHMHDDPHHGACGCGDAHAHDGCACGHAHGIAPEKSTIRRDIVLIFVAVALVVLAHFVKTAPALAGGAFWAALALYLIAYGLVGRKVLYSAFRNLRRGKIFDENFLMTVATFGAFAIGDFAEAVAVMIFYNIGETLQDIAVAKSRANIATLMDIRPDFARLVTGDTEREIAPEDARAGDVILIRPGERVPLDCVVLSGEGAVDASALTGESMPVAAAPGSALSNGSVNMNGVLTCKVTSVFADSTVQKILNLVSDASGKKADAEKFITRFSRIYTPIVMGLAALIFLVPPLFYGFDTLSEWFYRGLIFLVVSCPCALVVSIPVSFLGGIGGAARSGVLVKGGDVIDRLAQPKLVVFDKTGTLTRGKFAVSHVLPAAGAQANPAALLAAVALCERSSNHPIALSVRAYCGAQDSGAALDSYEEKAGCGVLATSGGATYAAGNAKLMAFVGAAVPDKALAAADTAIGTVLHVARDKTYLGTLLIADSIKPGVREAVARLHALGVEKCCMLTGDNENVARRVAEAVGLDSYKAGLLPNEKVAAFEALSQGVSGVSLYTGDGINDAPLLARADIGVAMGGVGSDAAIEAADVVLMTDEVDKIASAILVARRTRRIVTQNITFALGIKIIIMAVAALGFAPMWLAIFGDVGVALLAVANAARAVRAVK